MKIFYIDLVDRDFRVGLKLCLQKLTETCVRVGNSIIFVSSLLEMEGMST